MDEQRRTLRRPLTTNLAGFLVVGVVLSTQFLAQPYVWQDFEAPDILRGWVLVLRDKVFVSLAIGLSVTAVEMARKDSRRTNLLWLIPVVVIGASLSEWLLGLVDPQGDRSGLLAFAGRVLNWTLVGGGSCFILDLWRRSAEIAAVGEAAELRNVQAERLLTKIRLESLHRQIEPHFLFNTLATIRLLQRSKPSEGRMLLSHFMAFLEASYTVDTRERSTLGAEVAVVTAYLDVCAVRMGGLLRWSIGVPPEVFDTDFPRFGLATLVENSVKHGIAPSATGGSIAIEAKTTNGMLEVTVADTGVGFAVEHGSGIGLVNIMEQLRLRHGSAAALELSANRPHGVRAMIRLPVGVKT